MESTVAAEAVGQSRERAQILESVGRVMLKEGEELDQEARDIAQTALAKLSSHETLCTERWNQQREILAQLGKDVSGLKSSIDSQIQKFPAAIIAALTGLVGYLADRAFPLH